MLFNVFMYAIFSIKNMPLAWHINQVGNWLMVIAAIILISLLYPNSVKFKYEFQKGQTWRYEDLVAPFDFPIRKSASELQKDKDAIAAEFSPYYRLNTELQNAKWKDFEAEFAQLLPDLQGQPQGAAAAKTPAQYLETCRQFLDKIYKRGIIKLAPEHEGRGNDFVINLVNGNTIQKRTISGLYTQERALQMIADSEGTRGLGLPPALAKALAEAVTDNVTYDAAMTEKMRDEALQEIAGTKGVVRQGELVVKKGNVITEEVYEKLVSFRQKFDKDITARKSSRVVYVGYFLLTALIIGAFMMYLNSYRREILRNLKYLAFVLLWLVGFSYLTYLAVHTDGMSIYAIPYCIVPIVVRHFFTYRLAFFSHVVIVLIAGFVAQEDFQFAFTQIVAGVVSVLAVADARDWSKFFTSVLVILLAYALAHLGLSLIAEGNFLQVNWREYGWLVLNGLLILLAFPLIPLAERLFGFTSSISLVELTDINRPLLRQLGMKAPGTLQHSLQVANIAEAAASAVGADPLLIRAGALYHDIGKMLHPEFFIENQSSNSPHKDRNHLESARIIIEHVTEGERLAKKYGLPQVITNFILTHHGTTRVEYFYKTYLQENPGEEVDAKKFTYPGPKPRTKEEAILMLADSVEATSRTLKEPTGVDIDNLVDKIVGGKIEQGQLNKSKLTFGDVDTCKKIFKKMLRSIHHVRLEYPE